MALTTYLIRNASDHLSELDIELWKTFFKSLPKYDLYAIVYSKLVDNALTSAEGTLKARQLNALMKLIDDLGPGEINIKGDADGLYYSQPDERQALILEAFDIIFDSINTLILPFTTTPGGVAVGQRPLCGPYPRPLCGSPNPTNCVRHNMFDCRICCW